MSEMVKEPNENAYLEEIERIEKNSHSFLRYFGLFWGAILVFLIQKYDENSIAHVIADQIAQFFINPLGTLNLLCFLLLFSGVISILVSLIFLMLTIVFASKRVEIKPYEKHLSTLRKNFMVSVCLGIAGSVILFFLFILLLMNSANQDTNNATVIGNIFFYVSFGLIFIIAPFLGLNQKKWKGFWAWVNLVSSVFIGCIFLWSKVFSVNKIVMIIFLIVFLLYSPIRVVLPILWRKQDLFYTEKWVMKQLNRIFPDETWGLKD